MSETRYAKFDDLMGETITSISGMEKESECVEICTASGRTFTMLHNQDCCESVVVEDVTGNVDDLIGAPILKAEEATNSDNPPKYAESHTWTFYTFATVKGFVVLRWLGESNGYYSEDVSFYETTPAGALPTGGTDQ